MGLGAPPHTGSHELLPQKVMYSQNKGRLGGMGDCWGLGPWGQHSRPVFTASIREASLRARRWEDSPSAHEAPPRTTSPQSRTRGSQVERFPRMMGWGGANLIPSESRGNL